MLSVKAVNVQISGQNILQDVSVQLKAGQLTAIVGPSGSGKSTLLRAISGEIPYSGEIKLNGHEVNRLNPLQLANLRAVLPQETQVAFAFTAAEVVALGAFAGPPPSARKIEELLELVGLGGKGGRLVKTLSGGARLRARAAPRRAASSTSSRLMLLAGTRLRRNALCCDRAVPTAWPSASRVIMISPATARRRSSSVCEGRTMPE